MSRSEAPDFWLQGIALDVLRCGGALRDGYGVYNNFTVGAGAASMSSTPARS